MKHTNPRLWKVLIYFLAIASCRAGAATWAVRSPGADAAAFGAFLKTRPEITGYAEYRVSRQRPTPDLVHELLDRFEEARESYLNSSLKEARKRFQFVLKLIYKSQWNTPQRKVFYFSYLRLAQLSHDRIHKKAWVRKAVSFAPDLTPDSSKFPPPLRKQVQNQKKRLPYVELNPTVSLSGFDVLLVNGRRLPVPAWGPLKIPQAPSLVSWISNSLERQQEFLPAGALASYTPKRLPLLNGRCENPEWSSALSSNIELTGYFPKGCLKHRRAMTAHKWDNLKPQRSPTGKPKQVQLPKLYRKDKKNPILKSPWLWTGLSLLTAGAIYYNQKKKSENRRKTVVTETEREGF